VLLHCSLLLTLRTTVVTYRGLPPNYTTTKNTTKIERTTTTDVIVVFTWSVSQNPPKQLSDWSVIFSFQMFVLERKLLTLVCKKVIVPSPV
jgi:hypothetical protein